MANEATLRVRLEDPIDWTVDNTTGIEKGTICQISGGALRTAKASAGVEDLFAGIAAREKIASEGRTRLALYRRGIFDMTACAAAGAEGAIDAGTLVVTSGANLIRAAPNSANVTLSGTIIGMALEPIADGGTGEVMVGVH